MISVGVVMSERKEIKHDDGTIKCNICGCMILLAAIRVGVSFCPRCDGFVYEQDK